MCLFQTQLYQPTESGGNFLIHATTSCALWQVRRAMANLLQRSLSIQECFHSTDIQLVMKDSAAIEKTDLTDMSELWNYPGQHVLC